VTPVFKNLENWKTSEEKVGKKVDKRSGQERTAGGSQRSPRPALLSAALT